MLAAVRANWPKMIATSRHGGSGRYFGSGVDGYGRHCLDRTQGFGRGRTYTQNVQSYWDM